MGALTADMIIIRTLYSGVEHVATMSFMNKQSGLIEIEFTVSGRKTKYGTKLLSKLWIGKDTTTNTHTHTHTHTHKVNLLGCCKSSTEITS